MAKRGQNTLRHDGHCSVHDLMASEGVGGLNSLFVSKGCVFTGFSKVQSVYSVKPWKGKKRNGSSAVAKSEA